MYPSHCIYSLALPSGQPLLEVLSGPIDIRSLRANAVVRLVEGLDVLGGILVLEELLSPVQVLSRRQEVERVLDEVGHGEGRLETLVENVVVLAEVVDELPAGSCVGSEAGEVVHNVLVAGLGRNAVESPLDQLRLLGIAKCLPVPNWSATVVDRWCQRRTWQQSFAWGFWGCHERAGLPRTPSHRHT